MSDIQAERDAYVKNLEKHKAVLYDDDPSAPSVIIWKSPDTTINGINFILFQDTLFVSGDLGSAVYRWHHYEKMGWKDLLGMGFNYFFSMCEASDTGSRPSDWDPDKASTAVVNRIKEFRQELKDPGIWGGIRNQLNKQLNDEVTEIVLATGSSESWENYLRDDCDDDLKEVIFGEDWYEWLSIGCVPGMRAWMHWKGLQMALAQISYDILPSLLPRYLKMLNPSTQK